MTDTRPIGRGVGTTVEPGRHARLLDLDRSLLMEAYRDTGAVFFRGFDATIEDFEALSASLMTDLFTNRGAAFSFGSLKRSTVKDNPTLMTATGKRQDFPLPLHGEFYYFKHPPQMIWFYCATPAAEGGETTIGDGAEVAAAFTPATADRLRRRGIRYERYLPDGDWQVAFQSADRDEIARVCDENAATVSWGDDGSLVTEFRSSAFLTDSRGRDVFINDVLPVAYGELAILNGQAAQYAPDMAHTRPSLVVRWDDGTPIEPEILKEMLTVTSTLEVPVPARAGDILVVDNRRIMHGRRASNSPDRRVLVRMGAPNS
jgi:alpha-ketoglutarate-dependent taurine dioxygenase